jgi:hypothetical protein
VSKRLLTDDALREAFQWPVPAGHACTPEDLDRIARTLDGDLPAAERRQLVKRLSTDPALAEAWRVTHQLRPDRPAARVRSTAARRPLALPSSWIAAAAVAALAIGAVMVLRYQPSAGALRDSGVYTIESRLADGMSLPRDGFRLQWNPGPQDARYQVRITTEDLRLLTAVADLTEPEVIVSPATLANVAAGSRIFWQVEGLLPGGERIVSPTFVVRVQSGP